MVRYLFTILRSALGDAVKQDGLGRSDRATQTPSPSEARPQRGLDRADLGRFLGWADAQDRNLATGWRLLAATGMHRAEALALLWPCTSCPQSSVWCTTDIGGCARTTDPGGTARPIRHPR